MRTEVPRGLVKTKAISFAHRLPILIHRTHFDGNLFTGLLNGLKEEFKCVVPTTRGPIVPTSFEIIIGLAKYVSRVLRPVLIIEVIEKAEGSDRMRLRK